VTRIFPLVSRLTDSSTERAQKITKGANECFFVGHYDLATTNTSTINGIVILTANHHLNEHAENSTTNKHANTSVRTSTSTYTSAEGTAYTASNKRIHCVGKDSHLRASFTKRKEARARAGQGRRRYREWGSTNACRKIRGATRCERACSKTDEEAAYGEPSSSTPFGPV
jgi:hypothetical protein